MNVNVATAVRIAPIPANCWGHPCCVYANVQENSLRIALDSTVTTHPLTYSFPPDFDQDRVYSAVGAPLLVNLLDGCDVSIITAGQSGTGKTYTLYGTGLGCASSADEYGIVPRFIRDLFEILQKSHRNRTATIFITWSQIFGDVVQDLLGTGAENVVKSVAEAYHLLQIGFSNIAFHNAHTLFTITVEQQWFFEGKVQHFVSTASFTDLASFEKRVVINNFGQPETISTDPNLHVLQKCVMALTDPSFRDLNSVPYNQSTLTTLLRDSFGGRARTVVLATLSPLLENYSETYHSMQFLIQTQQIRNFVTINSYTENETPNIAENNYDKDGNGNADVFSLQFATNLLFKLVANAEEQFQRLISSGSLNKLDLEQVSHWLTQKQEYEECFSDNLIQHRSLGRIEEEVDADDCSDFKPEQDEHDSIDSSDYENMGTLMENSMAQLEICLKQFRDDTNHLVRNIIKDGSTTASTSTLRDSKCNTHNSEYHLKGARGRRNSIHSEGDFAPNLGKSATKIADIATPIDHAGEFNNDEALQNNERNLVWMSNELRDRKWQIEELENTIASKERLKQQLLNNIDTKKSVREKVMKNQVQLKTDHTRVIVKLLPKAKRTQNRKLEEQYIAEAAELKRQLHNSESIRAITEDGIKKVMDLENSLQLSRKQLARLKKICRKEESRKASFEAKQQNDNVVTKNSECICEPEEEFKSTEMSDLRDVVVLKTPDSRLAALRHEIRNLRRTREILIEKRCVIDKSRRHNATDKSSSSRYQLNSMLDDKDEILMLKYEEAIEAIDLAIEYKNELMCGREYIKALSVDQESVVDKMLIDRLLQLDDNEMRSLVHKYFDKVVHLRFTSKRLELQVIDAEQQNEVLVARVQNLNHALRQMRFESENRIVSMQRQHEKKIGTIMQYMAHLDLGKPNKIATAGITAPSELGTTSAVPSLSSPPVIISDEQSRVIRQHNKLIIKNH